MNMNLLQPRDVQAQALGRVAVLMGGSSSEREVSLMSGQGVLAALRSRGVDAFAFDPAEQALCELRASRTSRAFIALHGRHGEDGTVQGALELLGIPYTGPGVLASAMAIDKHMTKRLWQCDGLSTPAWRMVASAAQAQAAARELGLPLMFKASHEGSTLGLKRADRLEEVDAAFAEAKRFDAAVLAEQFIEGDEVTCGVLGEGDAAVALPLIHIVAPGGNYDFEHKYYSDETRYICPCELPAGEEAAIAQLVLASYRALGCRGWGRADIMIRATDRKPFLLEMNTSPGMTGHSLVPMAARVAGLSYDDLCLRILADARLDADRGAQCEEVSP
ncbi:MAG: D-alanine--D-alanine ligase [Betaproteobacteria bacterium]|nr:D-alanine--D-alanine ligase [Betaproteobacteria bacterium]MDE2123628.1 D-alanine--D-alanine ligase [Betaproteobacteria bacterium]MDE2186180.1 D-alanine--D-alanine ligase [Betaproteobacteria bacterium]